jgi:hypothetical protein
MASSHRQSQGTPAQVIQRREVLGIGFRGRLEFLDRVLGGAPGKERQPEVVVGFCELRLAFKRSPEFCRRIR